MKTKLIEKLTAEQEKQIAVYRNEGFRYGLGTKDKQPPIEEINKYVENLYKAINLPKPLIFHVDSPLAGMVATQCLLKFLKAPERDQLGGQLSDQFWDQLKVQLWDQLKVQLGDQLSDQLWVQLSVQLRGQLGDQLWVQLSNQLWVQLSNQLGGQLRDQLWDQLWDQLKVQLSVQLRGQLGDQLWVQLRDQLGDQLWDQLWDQLGDQLGDQLKVQKIEWNGNFIAGSQELFWLKFYEYINTVLPVRKTDQPLSEMIDLCKNVGWFWPYKGFIVIASKPAKLHLRNGRLHNFHGPSVEFDDGFKVYSINGIQFRNEMIEFVETPVDKLDPKKILAIKNVEQRAEIIKKFGIDRLFVDLKPKRLDQKDGYELYQLNIYPDVPRIYLKMQNPSVDEIHIEAVAPECKTVDEARHWRNFGTVELPRSGFIAPLILT